MIKRYLGTGSLILTSFLVIIGTWILIHPVLAGSNDKHLNYGGIFFIALGLSLVFNFKQVTLRKDGIHIKQIITGKETIIPKNEILQINIDIQPNGKYRHSLLKIQFKTFKSDLVLSCRPLTLDFLKEHYPKLINEQIHV